jgi:hypothetical protein
MEACKRCLGDRAAEFTPYNMLMAKAIKKPITIHLIFIVLFGPVEIRQD